jgi:hypothetical protein
VTLSFFIFLVVSAMAEISVSTDTDYYDTSLSSSGYMRRKGTQQHQQNHPTLVARSEHSSSTSSMALGEQAAKTMQDSMEDFKALTPPRELKVGTMLVHQGDMVVQLGQAGDAVVFAKEVEHLLSTVGRKTHDPTTTGGNENPDVETRIMMAGLDGGEDSKGYIEEKSIGYRGNEVDETLTLKLRIPSHHFWEFVDALEALVEENNNNKSLSSSFWKIQHCTTSSRDVTEQYVDATARADVLEASRSSIQSLLVHATSIQDVLAIQQELNRLTETQESHRQRALTLQQQSVREHKN